MTEILNDSIREQVREALARMKAPVHFILFSSTEHSDTCQETRQLIEEVVTLSENLSMDSYDINIDRDLAEKYHIDKTPELVITAKDGEVVTDYGIRLSGIPAGHEFTTLIQDILLISARESGLSQATRAFLKDLKKPVHLQVFVTPT